MSSENNSPMVGTPTTSRRRKKFVRNDSMGGGGHHHGHHHHSEEKKDDDNMDSLTYVHDESDAWRAHIAMEHYRHRGNFWNDGKHETMKRYMLITLVAVVQAAVAYFTNICSTLFITNKFEPIYDMLQDGYVFLAFLRYVSVQLFFACMAAACVYIEPVSAGSGIPEVKCYLNGIDLPRVGEIKTLVCKVLGVICSVSAGLPVGKEGPMVHSGAVTASVVSSGKTRNDKERRDLVACGAAAGVCTAFSAPVGGILFSLEEGASYWGQSLTWRTFYCSMIALSTLYVLNTIGSAFGKVGFNKLFSFGNFIFEGAETSFAIFELALFVAIGIIGGLIGAIFNNTNERITKWRMKHINHTKKRRIYEVMAISVLVSIVSFMMPLLFGRCHPLPEEDVRTAANVDELVAFLCKGGEEYNDIASLMFTEAGVAIRQLFHLHSHAFRPGALFIFFGSYISLAVVVYGIGVPSGLFVPSLLSGAAFGRLFGNLAVQYFPHLAFSNTYALIGAAAVLGGMARMTISLTVILLECTGNEQFVLPLMLTLMTARITGSLFNEDLYHIHIHMKKGVKFLESELRSITRHHNLVAGQIMSEKVVFVRPVEKVGIVYDILKSCKHSNFPVVDTNDGGVLFGTIPRSALGVLLKRREFGRPTEAGLTESIHSDYLSVEPHNEKYLPIIQWEQIEKSYPKYPSHGEIRLTKDDRDCFVDLRPYANTAPVTVQEFSSVSRTYEIFRSIGLRFLPVVNRYNQCVGTITRTDLTPEGLANTMLHKAKKHH